MARKQIGNANGIESEIERIINGKKLDYFV